LFLFGCEIKELKRKSTNLFANLSINNYTFHHAEGGCVAGEADVVMQDVSRRNEYREILLDSLSYYQ
jgi:hypothetical protein